tara:strand:- start:241 stop:645 length:405 start_codon:yes stop_codon:yes gene_type:complete
LINGRAKGHAFENLLIKEFQSEFGECANHLKRNLEQYQTAGKADIEFHNLMIEAKRYASGHWYKPEWWEQAKTSAGDTHIPVLIYKYDRQPIKMVFPLSIMNDYSMKTAETITVDWETGILLMRESLEFPNETV